MVLLVRNDIFMFAFLNNFVIKVVSLSMYVKVAHLCVEGCVCVAAVCSLDVSGGCACSGGGGGLWLWIEKALFCRMFCMIEISVLSSSSCRL